MNFKHLEQTKVEFNRIANEQERKGILKYGQPVDPLEGRDRLSMTMEEMVDGIKYLVAEQEKRKFVVNKIRSLLNYKENSVSKFEINYWLDVLEGDVQ